jgi:hypothetical protein
MLDNPDRKPLSRLHLDRQEILRVVIHYCTCIDPNCAASNLALGPGPSVGSSAPNSSSINNEAICPATTTVLLLIISYQLEYYLWFESHKPSCMRCQRSYKPGAQKRSTLSKPPILQQSAPRRSSLTSVLLSRMVVDCLTSRRVYHQLRECPVGL